MLRRIRLDFSAFAASANRVREKTYIFMAFLPYRAARELEPMYGW